MLGLLRKYGNGYLKNKKSKLMDNIPSAFSFALFSIWIKIMNSILNKEEGVKAKKSC